MENVQGQTQAAEVQTAEQGTKTVQKPDVPKMTLFQKLLAIQTQMKAPKNLYNKFGKFNYRNAEGILEALKPYEAQYGVLVILQDEIEIHGTQKKRTDSGETETPCIYVKATAHFIDAETGEKISTSAYARESDHTGMSADQCTGTASSYARKYCLNALFLLDDTKDSDTDEVKQIEQEARQRQQQVQNRQQAPQQNAQPQRNGQQQAPRQNYQQQGQQRQSWGQQSQPQNGYYQGQPQAQPNGNQQRYTQNPPQNPQNGNTWGSARK